MNTTIAAAVTGAAGFTLAAGLAGEPVLTMLRVGICGGALSAAALVDLRERRIPNRIVLPATAACAVLAAIAGSASLRAVVAPLLLTTALLVLALARPSALGMGDVKASLLITLALGHSRDAQRSCSGSDSPPSPASRSSSATGGPHSGARCLSLRFSRSAHCLRSHENARPTNRTHSHRRRTRRPDRPPLADPATVARQYQRRSPQGSAEQAFGFLAWLGLMILALELLDRTARLGTRRQQSPPVMLPHLRPAEPRTPTAFAGAGGYARVAFPLIPRGTTSPAPRDSLDCVRTRAEAAASMLYRQSSRRARPGADHPCTERWSAARRPSRSSAPSRSPAPGSTGAGSVARPANSSATSPSILTAPTATSSSKRSGRTSPPQRARNELSRAGTDARKHLGETNLSRERDRYQLNRAQITIDIDQLETLKALDRRDRRRESSGSSCSNQPSPSSAANRWQEPTTSGQTVTYGASV